MNPGSRIGPYEVLAPLGAGGMGEVYRALDPRIGREVALKVLPVHADADPDRVRRFEQEARSAGVLNHPNILTVHDVGTSGGQPYLVSELLEGETLRAHLSRGQLSVSRILDIGAQVARGLAAAHAKGVIHRDLKPENLFLTRDGRAKILDFGIAKLTQDGRGTLDGLTTAGGTAAGVIVGTAAYMSPEQVAGAAVDQRSDLFSLGVVLHEMLSARAPFKRDTAVETMTAVLRDDPPPLASDPRIPPTVERLVLRCLEKDPDERFQSARDLAFALQTLTTPTTAPAAAITAKGARRRLTGHVPWWIALAAAACGFAAAWFALRSRPDDAFPQFTRVVKLVATDAVESSPVLSPDGKWLAYLSNEGNATHLWVRFLSGGQSVNLTGGATDLVLSGTHDIGGLDISPDGTQIVFQAGSRGSRLATQQSAYVVPAPLGGPPRKLIDRGVGARWSPDGRQLVYVSPGGAAGDRIVVSDASGENRRDVLPVSGGIHTHWPVWSADGRHIYYQRSPVSWNAEPSEIWRVSSDGGAPERVIGSSRRALFPYPSRDGRGLLYSANPDSIELALWWKPWDREPRRITNGVGEYAQPRLSVDGRRLVAAAYQVRRSLRTMDVTAGSAPVQTITPGSNGDTEPAWSARAERLTFTSSRSGDQSIWTARADGTDPRQVTSGPALDELPRWSPDGTQIAFVSSRGGARGIWIVPADGGTPRHVVSADALNGVTWSPDGGELVYAAPAGDVPSLFRVSVDGGAPVRIPTPTPGSAPDWSPVTNLIAYVAVVSATRTTPGIFHAALIRPSGEPVALPPEPRLANGTVTWSPDGKWLVGISRPGGGGASMWLISVDGASPPRELVQFPDETRPYGVTWSTDGRRLFFGLQERTADIVLFEAGP